MHNVLKLKIHFKFLAHSVPNRYLLSLLTNGLTIYGQNLRAWESIGQTSLHHFFWGVQIKQCQQLQSPNSLSFLSDLV
jgi:hypothetical protein